MKNKLSNFKLFYFLRQLFNSENPDSKSGKEKKKVVVENNLRWEDDGGPVEAADPTPQVAENDIPRPTDAAGKDLL